MASLLRSTLFYLLLLTSAMFSTVECRAAGHSLVPQTEFDGPALRFEFPGMQIGVAEYAEGPTGATVFVFPQGVTGAVDVRGGAPGTINTDALRLGYEEAFVNAISLAGGSSYGLAAATGASLELRDRIDDPGWWTNIATVGGAIVFDLGSRRYNAITPDERLGRAAVAAAREGVFPLGARGAGRFVMQGSFFDEMHHSGQGGAYGRFGDVRVAVFTVVNSVGGIVGRDGRFVRCGTPSRRECPDAQSRFREFSSARSEKDEPRGMTRNTTISLVVTNKKLVFAELQRLAMHVHTSMARAIQPFHTINDGDTLFAVTTGEVDDEELSVDQLGVLAGELAWDAILSSVPALEVRPSPTERSLPADSLQRYAGGYEFVEGVVARVVAVDSRLSIEAPERPSLYLPALSTLSLIPAENGDFLIDSERKDVLRFSTDGEGAVTGMTINPGRWPVAARRLSR
jgi:L-aminopeptidase/D-esterase-like protein